MSKICALASFFIPSDVAEKMEFRTADGRGWAAMFGFDLVSQNAGRLHSISASRPGLLPAVGKTGFPPFKCMLNYRYLSAQPFSYPKSIISNVSKLEKICNANLGDQNYQNSLSGCGLPSLRKSPVR